VLITDGGTEKVDPQGHLASFGFSPFATRSDLPHSHLCEKYTKVSAETGAMLLGLAVCGSGTRNDSPHGHLAVFPAASSETRNFLKHFEHSIEIMARLISGNRRKQYGKRTELQLLALAVEIEKTASLVRIEGLEDVGKSVFPYPYAPLARVPYEENVCWMCCHGSSLPHRSGLPSTEMGRRHFDRRA
jgi:hypothetical protein